MLGPNNLVVPFVACGDLSGFDADQSYPLQLDGHAYEYHEPCQKPIRPPYFSYLQSQQQSAAAPSGGDGAAADADADVEATPMETGHGPEGAACEPPDEEATGMGR